MLGEQVRNIRKKRGITLKELAEKTGLSIGYISQIERDLTSHKQIGGDVQSGAEFAQGGQGRVGEIALDLGDVPDGQTGLFGQFLEGDSPLFPDILNMFAQHKTSRFFVKKFIYSISQNALYVNKQEKIRYL